MYLDGDSPLYFFLVLTIRAQIVYEKILIEITGVITKCFWPQIIPNSRTVTCHAIAVSMKMVGIIFSL